VAQRDRRLTLVERLRYSLYLAAIAGAALVLALSIGSADAVRLLPASADKLVFSPFFWLALYAVSYVVAPLVSRRFPIVRNGS
jgi:hypothetical protein